MNRRNTLALLGAAVAEAACAPLHFRSVARDPLGGESLYDDVKTYDRFGEHRTAGPADAATSLWLKQRLQASGFEVALQPFAFDLFEPGPCTLFLPAAEPLFVFPAWPPVETPSSGISATLVMHDAPEVAGRIVVIALPYRPYATWAQPEYGAPVKALVEKGVAGVIAITEGPTGDAIALNALPSRYNWTVPVVLAAGRDKAALFDAVTKRLSATLVSSGKRTPNAAPTNVIAHRKGRGRTVVLSTPKSGWFNCAAERGSGIAIFLALAAKLTESSDLDILCLATSGHEIDGLGGNTFLEGSAPRPEAVRLWLHLGASVACNAISISNGKPEKGSGAALPRGILASAALVGTVAKAFQGQPGYQNPIDAKSDKAVGEALLFRNAGYEPLIGLVGSNPLFHTALDRTPLATSPEILEPVARALFEIVRSI